MESYPVREQAGEKWKGLAPLPRPALPGQGRVTQIKDGAPSNCHSLPLVMLTTVLFCPVKIPCATMSVGDCKQMRTWHTDITVGVVAWGGG